MAHRLALGTALILGILLLYGVYAIDRIENLARQTARIHGVGRCTAKTR